MICPKCNQQIADDAVFCPECGADLRSAAAPEPVQAPYQQPQQGYQYQQQPTYGYQQPQQNYQYQQQPTYGYQQPSYSYSAPAPSRPARVPKVAKGGYIVSIILSALAMSFYFISMFADAEYVFGHNGGISIRYLITGMAFILLFIFSLLLRKIPTALMFIPMAVITFLMMIRFMGWAFHFEIFGLDYYFDTKSIIYFILTFSATVLFFITMLIKSKPLALRIITAVLFSALLIMELSYFFENLPYYGSSYVFAYFLGTFAYVFLYTIMIIVVFAAKKADSKPAQIPAA